MRELINNIKPEWNKYTDTVLELLRNVGLVEKEEVKVNE